MSDGDAASLAVRGMTLFLRIAAAGTAGSTTTVGIFLAVALAAEMASSHGSSIGPGCAALVAALAEMTIGMISAGRFEGIAERERDPGVAVEGGSSGRATYASTRDEGVPSGLRIFLGADVCML